MQKEMSPMNGKENPRREVPQTVYGRVKDHDKTKPRPTRGGTRSFMQEETGLLMRNLKKGVRNQAHNHNKQAVERQRKAEWAKQCLAPVTGATGQKATFGQ